MSKNVRGDGNCSDWTPRASRPGARKLRLGAGFQPALAGGAEFSRKRKSCAGTRKETSEADGATGTISGTKEIVEFGEQADYFVVGLAGGRMAVVDRNAAGVEIEVKL